MSDIYSAPEAELTENKTVGAHGSIEQAIIGDYKFDIGDTISEAWSRVKGNKMGFFLCSLVYFVVLAVSNAIVALLPLAFSSDPTLFVIATIIVQFAYMFAVMPIATGMSFIGMRASVDAPYSPSSLFVFFPKALKLFLVTLLTMLFIGFGSLLLIIPGIYLMVAYGFAMPLVADKNIGVWEAMEASRKAVSKRWFEFFALYLLIIFILGVSALFLGIGPIWTAPMTGIAYGICYRNMFGVESDTLDRS